MSSKHNRIAAAILLKRLGQPQSGRTSYAPHAYAPHSYTTKARVIEPRVGEDASRLVFVRAHYRRRVGGRT